ncbi:GNAT family N-acetyltransferase [Komarekiella sp. 'clone 1']|uniref:GNAT family N-acetyltransferase n=1 Tax=Komarekiella delphini-convector SJRDD-AB1 TaxID=2593771 RepID=A0AA40T262_9NOST|nr:GNAT family N-acetyltransferase [Komarekiella delphini-convector]MBD6619551.1 GNAT family N-acetyltransferase [Komarekiella delphini-convector SJRDD-AB1]
MLELINPTRDLYLEFIDMVAEYQKHGESRLFDQNNLTLIQENFSAYIQYLENNSKGISLKPGFVPATTFWLVKQSKVILGESQLRHWLIPTLEHRGGHIGYMIRPLQRSKGYGTQILAMTLEKARNMGLSRVLLTCKQDNLASACIIQKNQGKLTSEEFLENSDTVISRYWIDL